MNALQNYINDSLTELHQVRWPTRQQAVRLSVIVVGFILLSSFALGLTDFVIGRVVSFILSLS